MRPAVPTIHFIDVYGKEIKDNMKAVDCNMKRPQLVSPGSLNRMLQTANEAWERRDFQQSFELLERASRLDPANSRILLQMGQQHGLALRLCRCRALF